MSARKKILIVFGVVGLLAALAILALYFVLRPQVVSRVPIPGSSMTAIVIADLGGCYDVQLFDQGRSISGLQCLGPYVSQRCSLVGTSTESNIFTINWTDEGNNYSTTVNVAARRFAVYSNNVPVQ